ncbi:MAG TPA: DALR anticodon-binding domain-containing protein [Streptosporangiaceae bacterium]
MIPADLGAELARAITAAVTSGDFPPAARGVTQAGTWRPAGPGGYASSLPFGLAAVTGEPPAQIARQLARRIEPVTWIVSARATGAGYLTVTVTPAALAALAPRMVAAGPGCARGDSLRGATRPAPPLPDLATAPDWHTAWQDQAAALAGRLAQAAGAATTHDFGPERLVSGTRPRDSGLGTVADAVAFAGADAVRCALSRIPADRPADVASYAHALDAARHAGLTAAFRELPPELPSAALSAEPPSYPREPERQQTRFCCRSSGSKSEFTAAGASREGSTVAFAHADAASVLRWGAELGLAPGEWPATPPDYAEPELAVLTRLSWLPERVGAAARRECPAEFPRYLEALASDWRECRERCPALPFGGRSAPRAQPETAARLWLADAVRVALAAGLGLIGVTARDRL